MIDMTMEIQSAPTDFSNDNEICNVGRRKRSISMKGKKNEYNDCEKTSNETKEVTLTTDSKAKGNQEVETSAKPNNSDIDMTMNKPSSPDCEDRTSVAMEEDGHPEREEECCELKENRENQEDMEEENKSETDMCSVRSKSDGNSVSGEEDSEMKFVCPICDTILGTQHEFTLHIRSHNNDLSAAEESQLACIGKGFTCRICGKVLSSSSSLDRHVLVHSGERPFKCRVCGVSFTTNGNMHRHMRTHPHAQTGKSSDSGYNYESDGSSDSYGSTKKTSPSMMLLKKRKTSRTAEFNNNNIELSPRSLNDLSNKRYKNDPQEDHGSTSRRKLKGEDKLNRFKCPICEREDFLSLNLLETHLEENHPEYKARCDSCNLIFKNHRVLNLHRFMVHPDQDRSNTDSSSTVGFKDLTFVDFSSEKFPYIARMVCEQSLHRASSAYHRFQCNRCDRAFPLASALQIHQQNCGNGEADRTHEPSSSDNEGPTDLSRTNQTSSSDENEDERRRDSFFARLDLQNKSSPSSPDSDDRKQKNGRFPNEGYFNSISAEVKDLADIQSIISVTSAGGLIPDLSKSPQPSSIEVTPPDSGSRVEDEEQQDCFAAEFRKMKLRGEFPCRLCTAIFPNLRALKGHNRVHLSASPGNSAGPYRCNMCPHFSSDKSALIRHMRTHNGDRPYECGLCHYAFTTKANCERHLRNRHAKMSREDVKKSIIYHPSEDPTNDVNAASTLTTSREDVKRSLFTEKLPKDVEKVSSIPLEIPQKLYRNESLQTSLLDQGPAVVNLQEKPFTLRSVHADSENTLGRRKSLDVGTMTSDEELNTTDLSSGKQSDGPLDLSMDALDLSRKRSKDESDDIIIDDSEPQDLSKKSRKSDDDQDLNCKPYHDLNILTPPTPAQNFDSPKPQINIPKLDLSQFYAGNPSINPNFFVGNNPAFPTFPSGPAAFPPYFLTPPPPPHALFPRNPAQEFVEMKERLQKELIRGLQLTSGGSLVLDQIAMATAADRMQSYHNQALAEYNRRIESVQAPPDNIKAENSVLQQKPTEVLEKSKYSQKSGEKVSATAPRHESSSVKMVIKNGVLIPKQKQRRYRTERPFSCEHCSARFTLRSNMERHIKQQHPQFWTQRQRSTGHINSRRSQNSSKGSSIGPTGSLNSQLSYFPHLVPNSDEPSLSSPFSDDTPKKDNISLDPSKPAISDEVKNALAQQLKLKQGVNDDHKQDDYSIHSDQDEEGDEDDEGEEQLIIDEETKEEESKEVNVERKLGTHKEENVVDLASVSRLLDNASTQTFKEYFHSEEDHTGCDNSEEDEEGLVAGSTSEGNNSGSDENRSESDTTGGNGSQGEKKKSAYSLAPNRVSCPYCFRKFPWSSSLRRHVLTHTGQKPFKCSHCSLLFTTKSNCDRHLLRKHGNSNSNASSGNNNSSTSKILNESRGSTSNDESSDLSDPKKQNSNYTMRNVPERPYKCKYCPSSTFSTLSNLRKHLSSKHMNKASDDGKKSHDGSHSGYDSHGSAGDEGDSDGPNTSEFSKDPVPHETVKTSGTSSIPQDSQSFSSVCVQGGVSSDLPFKCHLCDSSFSERQEALDHIKDFHTSEYQLLASKGALDANNIDEGTGQDDNPCEENIEQLRGKFPDYANRKVMCAFCLRRFWSAEDLRRHMRTHTGERPFSCDICRRRFTLKHSMLRHRKKHSLISTTSPIGSDDEPASVSNNNNTNNNNNNILSNKSCHEESDLISNLLGIQDRSIVDKMLISKSAEDAAKLLGVQQK